MKKLCPDKSELEKLKKLLKELCGLYLPSVLGGERAGVLSEYLSERFDNVRTDRMGNVILGFGSGDYRVMADAHYDEVALAVKEITPGGFVKVVSPVGVDLRILPAAKVRILGRKTLDGVVFALPPHLSDGGEKELSAGSIYIDVGMDEKQAGELISVGDAVVYERTFSELAGGRIASNSLDNRISVASLILIAEWLKTEPPADRAVDIIFSYGEENGMNGAKTAAYGRGYRAALIMDGTFGSSPETAEEEAKPIGGGPCIGVSPLLDRSFSDFLIGRAEKLEIPYNIEVMPGSTGTNSMAYFQTGGGIPSAMISPPLKYMHTPAETADLRDVWYAARLGYDFLIQIGWEGFN